MLKSPRHGPPTKHPFWLAKLDSRGMRLRTKSYLYALPSESCDSTAALRRHRAQQIREFSFTQDDACAENTRVKKAHEIRWKSSFTVFARLLQVEKAVGCLCHDAQECDAPTNGIRATPQPTEYVPSHDQGRDIPRSGETVMFIFMRSKWICMVRIRLKKAKGDNLHA